MTRLPRNPRRLVRPAIAVVLVFAQAVAAFGFPVVKGRNVRACGCLVPCGTTPDCCCPTTHASPAAPTTAACPKCNAKDRAAPPAEESGVVVYYFDAPAPEAPCCATGGCCRVAGASDAKPADVAWVSAVKARQCRGEWPGGVLAESPAVPPVVPVRAAVAAAIFPPPVSAGDPHFVTDPSDPPPRG